jgi:RNA polymerase sigma-70 factor (ECF subfamily)
MNKPKQAQQQSEIDLPKSELIELRAAIKAKIGQQLRSMYARSSTRACPTALLTFFAVLMIRLTGGGMSPDKNVREVMLAAVPGLRAFAISLCGNVDRADDLVQEALLRALSNIRSFEPGTNMSAWLFTILRNLFRSEYRKRRREVEDVDGSYAEQLASLPQQNSRVEINEFREALKLLPPEQRESLILVGASGFSYEEAAQICECAVGTIKSRVNRARRRLAEILLIKDASDLGADRETIVVVNSGIAGSDL